MTTELEQQIAAAQEAVTKQGDTVRSLKASAKEGKAEKASRVPKDCLGYPRERGPKTLCL